MVETTRTFLSIWPASPMPGGASRGRISETPARRAGCRQPCGRSLLSTESCLLRRRSHSLESCAENSDSILTRSRISAGISSLRIASMIAVAVTLTL
jgi:hypothetical protein